jgi:hypothetical protein
MNNSELISAIDWLNQTILIADCHDPMKQAIGEKSSP